MKLAPLVDKLLTLTDFAGRVSAATDLESAVEKVKTQPSPSCVLFGVKEEASPNQLATGGPRHQVKVTISLLIVCRSAADMRGAAAYDQLDTVRSATMAELLGWMPTDQTSGQNWNALQYVGGNFAYADAGTLVWLDQYLTDYTLMRTLI